MNKVEKELDLLKQDIDLMVSESDNHPIFTQINEWEQESTIKIQVTAELARADLSHLIQAKTTRLKSKFDRISHEIKSNNISDQSKITIDQWLDEIKTCQQDIANAFKSVKAFPDPEIQFVEFLTVKEKDDTHDAVTDNHNTVSNDHVTVSNNHEATLAPVHIHVPLTKRVSLVVNEVLRENVEHFEMTDGDVELTDNSTFAKKTSNLSASIRGATLYSRGTHQLRFRIEHLSNNSIFIGIIPSIAQMTRTSFKLNSVYGWWDTKFPVIAGTHLTNGAYSMRSGDEILLTLVCDEGTLIYHNKRGGYGKITVNLNSCPLPWHLLVVLGAGENSIRMLPWK